MKEKRLDYELMRILAIFLVVFNHTENRGFFLYQAPGCSAVNAILSLLLATVCKIAVPLFFMISGGLLLHRQETLKDLLCRRIVRMALVLVLFSGILYGFWIHWGFVPHPGIRDFVRRVLTEGISIPLLVSLHLSGRAVSVSAAASAGAESFESGLSVAIWRAFWILRDNCAPFVHFKAGAPEPVFCHRSDRRHRSCRDAVYGRAGGVLSAYGLLLCTSVFLGKAERKTAAWNGDSGGGIGRYHGGAQLVGIYPPWGNLRSVYGVADGASVVFFVYLLLHDLTERHPITGKPAALIREMGSVRIRRLYCWRAFSGGSWMGSICFWSRKSMCCQPAWCGLRLW